MSLSGAGLVGVAVGVAGLVGGFVGVSGLVGVAAGVVGSVGGAVGVVDLVAYRGAPNLHNLQICRFSPHQPLLLVPTLPFVSKSCHGKTRAQIA